MVVGFPQDEEEAASGLSSVSSAIEDCVCGDLVGEKDLAVKGTSWVECECVVLYARVQAASAGVHETVAGCFPSGVESVGHVVAESKAG